MPATCPPFFPHSIFRRSSSTFFAVLLLALSHFAFAPALLASNNPVPFIDLVAPVSIHPGTTGVTLTVLGTGFVSTSVVKWNSTSLTTTFVSSKKLTAAVPDALVAAVGLGSITVVSPTPGGGASNVYYIPVASQESSTTFPSSPSSSITVGNTPQGITTADLNGDGHLDLAVANNGSNTVTILLGSGNGTFTTKSTPSAGNGANWVAIGDFNEDGIPDLAVADLNSSGSAGVTILLGHGDGTYTAGATLTTGNGPFAITTADFNGDGHLDLAVSNQNSNTISVFLGVGNGTFGSGATYAVGDQPQVIVPGDFNEDGILDLAVSNVNSASVSVLLGTGSGTFGTAATFGTGGSEFPIGLIAADFNGDNHLDLAAVNASDVAILLGDGAGSFTLHSNPGTGSTFLIAGVAGDYNGDGNLDIIVSDEVAGEAFFLPGNGNGTFGSAETFTTAAGAFGVATADFNGDGALDLAVANGTAGNVSIFLQRLPVSLSPTSIAFGNQAVGVGSTPQTVTLINNSGSSLTFSSIAFTGADNLDFSPGGTCSTSTPVANNGTCTITVTFTPGAFGARTATLTITDNAGNSPQTLGLTGTGTLSPPSITKAFGASTMFLNSSISLTFTITNPNSTSPLTGVAFTDSLPSGITVSTPNGLTGTCGSGGILAVAGSSSISLSGGTLAASGSCNFSVNVTGTTEGSKLNSVLVTSTEGGNGNTSTASVQIIAPPSISISFTPTSIPLSGGDSMLGIVISNPNSPTLTGIAFTDTLSAGLTIATNPNEGSNCGGTVIAVANSNTISMTGGSIGGGGNCSVSVHVTGVAAGTQSDTTGAVSSTEGGTGTTSNTASLTVVAPPSIAKAFGASSIASGGLTSLTLTITNPSANTVTLTGVAFTDSLPSGLVVATPNGLANTCAGVTSAVAGSSSVSLSGGVISIASNCAVSVNVTSSTVASYTNVTAAVSSTNGGTGNTATANLGVLSPPSITKSFGAATVPLNGSTSLTFTITNPNSSTTLSGLAFTDSLPSGLVVATPNGFGTNCTGTITAVAGSSSVSLSSSTLAGLASCSVGLNISGSTAGVKNNSVTVTSTQGGTGNTSNASVTVVTPPTLANAFGAASIPLNGSNSLTFTISNPNATVAVTGVSFTDSLPSGLVVSTPNGLTGSCGSGTIAATAGSTSIALSNGIIAASSSCNFSINVSGTTPGAKSNLTGSISSTEGGTGNTASANLAVLAPPGISESFGVSSVAPNATTSLTFTLTNPSANTQSLAGVAFTDALPTGLVVATPNSLSNTCGGAASAVAGSSSLSLSAASIPVSNTCTFSLNVTATASGPLTNTTSAVTSTNGGSGNIASASLAVGSPASITSSNSTAFVVGVLTSFTITTTGSPTSSISLAGSLPAGLTFIDNGNGTATISGTPLAASDVGAISLTLTAHNGSGLDATQSFTLTLNKGVPTLSWAAPSAITFGTALSSAQLNATAGVPGTFTYTPAAGTTLSAGSQSLSALFTPTDSVDFTTATTTVSITVNKATPTVIWSAPSGAIAYGTALSSAQLDATSSVPGTFVYSPAAGTILNAGSQTISVTFTPADSADNTSATDQITLTVNPASTSTSLTSSAASANPGSSVTFTATVSSSSSGIPTGSISFLDGATTLTTASLTSGSASFTTSVLAAGTHTITATYAGSTNFAASASAAFTETITTPDFSLSSPPSTPMPSGQNINVPVTVTPVGGLSGQLQLSIADLPPRSSAFFQPPVLALGASPSMDTLVIVTTPRFDYLARRIAPNSRAVFAGFFWFPLAGLFLGGAGLLRRGDRRRAACFFLLILLVGSGLLAGCASIGNFQNTGTPAGTYTLTITAAVTTASGTTTHSEVVTITVR